MNKLTLPLLALALAACASQTDDTELASTADATKDAATDAAVEAAVTPEAPEVATVGLPAPGFRLVDQDGNAHELADFAGSPVVLEWFNHGCPFVVKHYESGNMQALQERYIDQGVVWLSICSSAEGKQGYFAQEAAAGVIDQHGMNSSAVLRDPDGTVGRRYAAKTTPHMFVIDTDGTLLYDGAIDSIATANPDDIAGATNHVASVLDAVLAGEAVEPTKNKPYGCSVKYAR